MTDRFVIGVDYGTQSARAQVISVKDGKARGEAVYSYPHGVMSRELPGGTALTGGDWALAHPKDYWNALKALIPKAMKEAGVCAAGIAGISIAATACSLLPVNQNLEPLCVKERFQKEPHAYLKLWKHHRAEPDARRLTAAAKQWNEDLLSSFGGAVSSEWAIPKMMEVLREAPMIYEAAEYFMQVSDWLDSRLTGKLVRSGGVASFKALYDRQKGYPSREFLQSVGEKLPDMVEKKLRGEIFWPGEKAGELTASAAGELGLMPGTCVGSGHTDAHSAALGAGACRSGDYLVALGTSAVTHFLHERHCHVPGVNGSIRGGLLPGLTCYTAGQACVGDMLEWFVRLTNPDPKPDAYAALEEKAAALFPGESGLCALDWWNGNRSILGDGGLTGLIVGLTMDTKAWDIYRALLEAAAFGQRTIRDQFERYGLSPRHIILCGGIAGKSPLLCQILADVFNAPVEISGAGQAAALGAAMCAATAAGEYPSLKDAVVKMKAAPFKLTAPIPAHAAAYDGLFQTFSYLHQAFGVEAPWVMKGLRNGKKQAVP